MQAKDFLTADELKALTQRSWWRGAGSLLHTWLWIAGVLFVAGMWPTPWTIAAAVVVLGAKQLACAIIMHDASHYAIFPSRRANEWLGNWFGGFPIFIDLRRYRPYHLAHHSYTGSDDDPDLGLTRGYPTSPRSMARKVARDLLGLTGLKAFGGLLLMHAGVMAFNLGNRVAWVPDDQRPRWLGSRALGQVLTLAHNLAGPLAAQGMLLTALWFAGAPWLYTLWLGAYFTTYQLFLRVRSIAEHSVVPNRLDAARNTRTTRANWLARMLVAPHHVNFHAEHHLVMTVPSYRLPAMHRLLRERGYYERGLYATGYLPTLRAAMARA